MNVNSSSSTPNHATTTITIPTEPNWEELSQQDSLHLTLSTLEQSTSLYQTCIDHEAIALNQTSKVTTSQGSVLIDQLENLAAVARTLGQVVEMARKENTNLVTTGFTLAGGIGALMQGHIPSGLFLTGAALNQVKNIIMGNFKTSSDTKDIVNEIKTGLLMIKQLEEYQQASLGTIHQQIESAEEQLAGVEAKLSEIKNLATQGSKDGDLKKQEANKLGHESSKAYRQAIYNLSRSHSTIIGITNDFGTIIERFELLINQAKSENLQPADIKEFISQTEGILKQMKGLVAQ